MKSKTDMANDTTPEPQAESEARVYETLQELVIAEGEPTGNQRAYCVRLPDVPPEEHGERYVVSNSPGNAALAVVEATAVSRSEMLAAARAVINAAKRQQP